MATNKAMFLRYILSEEEEDADAARVLNQRIESGDDEFSALCLFVLMIVRRRCSAAVCEFSAAFDVKLAKKEMRYNQSTTTPRELGNKPLGPVYMSHQALGL